VLSLKNVGVVRLKRKQRNVPSLSQRLLMKARDTVYRNGIFSLSKTWRSAQHVLVNAQILELAKVRVEKEKLDLNDQQLRGKLNRSIHKLANKRGNLVKVDYPGKGFAYGLPNWTDKNNEIKKKYLKG
jgi:hypothetical protein